MSQGETIEANFSPELLRDLERICKGRVKHESINPRRFPSTFTSPVNSLLTYVQRQLWLMTPNYPLESKKVLCNKPTNN